MLGQFLDRRSLLQSRKAGLTATEQVAVNFHPGNQHASEAWKLSEHLTSHAQRFIAREPSRGSTEAPAAQDPGR